MHFFWPNDLLPFLEVTKIVSQESVIQEIVSQESVIQESVIQEIVSQESVIQESVIQENDPTPEATLLGRQRE